MKKLLDYRILLIVWLSIGLSVSGFFYINPTTHTYRESSLGWEVVEDVFGPTYTTTVSYKNFQISSLVTVVGCLLIGGIGYITSKKS